MQLRQIVLPIVLIAAPVQADTADALRAALAGIPQETGILGPSFGDADVAARVIAMQDMSRRAPLFSGPAGPLLQALPPLGSIEPQADIESAWPPRLGFGPADVAVVATWGDPRESVMQFHLRPGAAAGVPAVLTANGYEEAATELGPVMRRGAEDYAISLADRDPSDPFGGRLGQSSRVLIAGDVVSRAAGMAPLQAMAAGPWWDSRADMSAALDALDGLEEGTGILRALVLDDPTLLAPEVQLSDPVPPGIPPWSVMLVAETVLPAGEAGVTVALVYATANLAQAASEGIAAGWTIPGPRMRRSLEDLLGPLDLAISGNGPFVVLVSARGNWAPEGPLMNTVSQALWNAIVVDDLALFAPPF